MRDIVDELRYWKRQFAADYETHGSDRLPTEGNALRQLIFSAVQAFLEDSLGDTAFEAATRDTNDIPLSNYVTAWVDHTYGSDDKAPDVSHRLVSA